MNIYINDDGTINAIGFLYNYPFVCPKFITLENFTRMKCININDHMNPDSWIEIEPEVLN